MSKHTIMEMVMKVFVDREYMQYLMETNQEFTGTEYSELEWNNMLRFDFYQIHGVTKSHDRIFGERIHVYISTPDTFTMVFDLPPDVFAGTDDFTAGLNAGLDTSAFWT